jgi:hypothetical protein
VDVEATPLRALPPPSTDGVDRLYHQLVKIHAIIASEVCPLAPVRLNIHPGSCLGRLVEAYHGAFRGKDDIITGQFLTQRLTMEMRPSRRTPSSLIGSPGGHGCATRMPCM